MLKGTFYTQDEIVKAVLDAHNESFSNDDQYGFCSRITASLIRKLDLPVNQTGDSFTEYKA
jgi:hypothetical protein